MSIRSDAYSICKTVWNSPSRGRLKSLIGKLNASDFGYLARGQHAQILGFLIIDKKQTDLEKVLHPLRIVPLESEELVLLSKAHKQIVQLNIKCIATLSADLPQCVRAVDPYGRFEYEEPCGVPEGDILTAEAIEEMAASFHKHPAMKVALQSILPATRNMTESKYVESMLKFNEILIKAGVFKAPDDFTNIIFSQAKDSLQRTIARHIIALTCIRASLSTLDQLIYQAILNNKLPLLNENNIIEIGPVSNNLAGNGLSILYQPSAQLFIADICDLVLVKSEHLDMPLGQLWQVEGLHHEYSQEFGHTEELILREVDENLNPFGPLLEQI